MTLELAPTRVSEEKLLAEIHELAEQAQLRRRAVHAHGRKMYEETHGVGSYAKDHSFFEHVARILNLVQGTEQQPEGEPDASA